MGIYIIYCGNTLDEGFRNPLPGKRFDDLAQISAVKVRADSPQEAWETYCRSDGVPAGTWVVAPAFSGTVVTITKHAPTFEFRESTGT